ncbi:MAG: nucleoside recognition domain-containing protein [Desulfuromonadales bacterium]
MTVFLDACLGALMLCGKLVIIVVPLMVIFEVLRYVQVFRSLGSRTEPAMRYLGLGRSAVLPLFTGIFLGIAYGAGIIIRSAAAGQMNRRELFLTGLFLATCHAVIEDVLIFVVLGGDAVVMLGLRLALAILLTSLLARFWKQPE